MRRREFITILGGAAAWPFAAQAQQPALPVIGLLTYQAKTSGDGSGFIAAFRHGLTEQGYVDGGNVEVLYHWAELDNDRVTVLVTELVRRRVAVIVMNGSTAAARTAKATTTTIPIVFIVGSDPVESHLVASLSRPGGNVTGVTVIGVELVAKRLELLHEIVPAVTSVGYLSDPTFPGAEARNQTANNAAQMLGLRLLLANASTPRDIEPAFSHLVAQGIGAFLSGTDPLFLAQGTQLAALATRHSVPAIFGSRTAVAAGGLMSYGASRSDAERLAGSYAGRILKGEKPADLPVIEPTRFELILNLKAARSLRIEVPTVTLLRASEIIE
jgi:putative ABC transport system substrate-binding protein